MWMGPILLIQSSLMDIQVVSTFLKSLFLKTRETGQTSYWLKVST